MFEVPNAKRIKRSELFETDTSPSSSRASSPADTAQDSHDDAIVTVPNYGFEYDFITPEVEAGPSSNLPVAAASKDTQPATGHDQAEQDDAQEYQFRLFTTTSTSTTQANQQTSQQQPPVPIKPVIRLSRTPSPSRLFDGPSSLSLERAHFIHPNRPETYYFTFALPAEQIQVLRSQYAEVAISTTDVLGRAESTRWPGTTLPWRVIHVELANPRAHRALSRQEALTVKFDGDGSKSTSNSKSKSKSKPSKKRRIVLRQRLAKRAELARQMVEAELTEKEKRTRRNREKKVKRKEREKRKKLLETGGGQGSGGHDGLHDEVEDSNADSDHGGGSLDGKGNVEMSDGQTTGKVGGQVSESTGSQNDKTISTSTLPITTTSTGDKAGQERKKPPSTPPTEKPAPAFVRGTAAPAPTRRAPTAKSRAPTSAHPT